MQEEVLSIETQKPITIIGINAIGFESANDTLNEVTTLPVLQDTEAENVWEAWDVTYRDVIIVDSEGHKVGVFNLTSNSLAEDEHNHCLKEMLLQAANTP